MTSDSPLSSNKKAEVSLETSDTSIASNGSEADRLSLEHEQQDSLVSQERAKLAVHVSHVTIMGNLLLTVLKLVAGLVAHSAAMVSDAIHTASDVVSTFIVIVSVKIASRRSDSNHQYGHERFESLGSLLLSLMLMATGLGIGYSGLKKIFSAQSELAIPGDLALYAAFLSIVGKEAMYWYTIIAANRINSEALKADAWHHRSDAISSIGALIGLWIAKLGYSQADPLASLLICLFIIKTAWDICRDSIEKLTDESCPDSTVQKMRETAASQEGVLDVRELKTRLFGPKVYMDITIACRKDLTLEKAHSIAEDVHLAIEHEFPQVKHCNVHVDPY